MSRLIKSRNILITISFIYLFLPSVWAGGQVVTDIKVIHASTGTSEQFDSSLKSIIHELKSVFKYTSYKLLKDQRFSMNFNQENVVNLPGNRTLLILASDTDGKRIRYQINILKNYHSIFQTQVMLKNNSSITIGGPELDNGALLINVSGALQ
ncbi:MAG: hypothetical protein WC836_11205 [Desulfobacula sp.]|jgi:hypothetical protein